MEINCCCHKYSISDVQTFSKSADRFVTKLQPPADRIANIVLILFVEIPSYTKHLFSAKT